MLTQIQKYQNILFVIALVVVAFLLGSLRGDLFGATGGNLSGAAGALAADIGCELAPLSGENPTGLVLADPLNMRVGPGLNYHIVTLLDFCTSVRLVGRDASASWLEVQLPGNIHGWVYAYYILPGVNLMNELDDTTGFGGEDTSAASASSSGTAEVSVIINYNYAAVFVSGMAANTEVSAVLSPSGNSANGVYVASGVTDGSGNATLTFTMPTKWADSSAVQSGTMDLTISAGSTTVNAWLSYYTE